MISFFSNIVGGFKDRHTQRRDPGRDWLLLLGASGIVLLASVVWNTWFFLRVVEEGVGNIGGGDATLAPYETGAAEEIFLMRETKASEYKEVHTFIDPSRE